MAKITYLFGAGASKNALPIVNEIPIRLKKLIQLLESDELALSDQETYKNLAIKAPNNKRSYQLDLIEDLKWVLEASENHASVDTFAKKLFIQRQYQGLEKLKTALSVFFIFEQAQNPFDKRYDTFFASIHNSLFKFPDNMRILSWNYDYQFELAYMEYHTNSEMSGIQESLNIKHKYDFNKDTEGFSIFKLNGTTGLYTDRGFRQYRYINNINSKIDKLFCDEIVRNFVAVSHFPNVTSNFSFAWEQEDKSNCIIEAAIRNVNDCHALVIIGYSFPFFNREIDRRIIGSMKNLKSVYFQSPDADVLIERFKAIRDDLTGVELIPKFDTGQFVLPNEL